jgi:MOSC domain-containing protein YiiM
MPRLLSVNVGLPRDVTWNGKTVRSAIWKSPVEGRRMARKLDIDGDAQGDQCAGALMFRDAKLLPTLHVKAAPASFEQSSGVF